jgi:hypothetical protein
MADCALVLMDAANISTQDNDFGAQFTTEDAEQGDNSVNGPPIDERGMAKALIPNKLDPPQLHSHAFTEDGNTAKGSQLVYILTAQTNFQAASSCVCCIFKPKRNSDGLVLPLLIVRRNGSAAAACAAKWEAIPQSVHQQCADAASLPQKWHASPRWHQSPIAHGRGW